MPPEYIEIESFEIENIDLGDFEIVGAGMEKKGKSGVTQLIARLIVLHRIVSRDSVVEYNHKVWAYLATLMQFEHNFAVACIIANIGPILKQ